MKKPTVWVVKEQVRRDAVGPVPMDYSPAFKYGEVKFITNHDLPLHQGGTLASGWYYKVQSFITDFDEDCDWIILTGSPVAIFIVGWLTGIRQRTPRVLVWRRESNEYVPYSPIPTLETMAEADSHGTIVQ